MIKPSYFCDLIKQNGGDFFCGVPDSLLKEFCAYVTDSFPPSSNVIAANEGNAVALACGHYLASEKIGVVYMQNSGLGNCVNPLLSLSDEEVYSIPLLMLVGWRGEPGIKDEPQHVKQGKLTGGLLERMGIAHEVLSGDSETLALQVEKAFAYMRKEMKPYAFVVRKGLFEKYSPVSKRVDKFEMPREAAVKIALDSMCASDITVATTGQISREVYEARLHSGISHERDFITVGSMGHASSIAMGIALEKPGRKVFCLDGDGALLMHMGVLPVIASMGLKNFTHIVFNNEAHDSVGGQPTVANMLNFPELAKNCGYAKAVAVSTEDELRAILAEFAKLEGTLFLEVKVKRGSRADLGRPKESPVENKLKFMSFLK